LPDWQYYASNFSGQYYAFKKGDFKMAIHGSWLVRGYFDLSQDNPRHSTTQEIRDILSTALGHQLQIASYPVGPAWRHTFWWREGTADYAEAQFFVRIDEDCPVLSIGVSVEKGREGVAGDIGPASERMDRATWDWQRLIEGRLVVLALVPEIAARVQRPVSLRLRVYHAGQLCLGESLTFNFVDGQWFRRHRGNTDMASIASHLEAVDQQIDRWVDLYFAVDLGPSVVEGMSAADVASLLLRFQQIRQQLRP
jgi:hypothetical protein